VPWAKYEPLFCASWPVHELCDGSWKHKLRQVSHCGIWIASSLAMTRIPEDYYSSAILNGASVLCAEAEETACRRWKWIQPCSSVLPPSIPGTEKEAR
jgi:hypothetical protein